MSNSSSPAVTPLPIDGPPNEEPTHDLKESVSRTIVGNANSFGIWSPHEGWDLTHPDTPDSPPVQPRIHLQSRSRRIQHVQKLGLPIKLQRTR
jgi:hypothetical protein